MEAAASGQLLMASEPPRSQAKNAQIKPRSAMATSKNSIKQNGCTIGKDAPEIGTQSESESKRLVMRQQLEQCDQAVINCRLQQQLQPQHHQYNSNNHHQNQYQTDQPNVKPIHRLIGDKWTKSISVKKSTIPLAKLNSTSKSASSTSNGVKSVQPAQAESGMAFVVFYKSNQTAINKKTSDNVSELNTSTGPMALSSLIEENSPSSEQGEDQQQPQKLQAAKKQPLQLCQLPETCCASSCCLSLANQARAIAFPQTKPAALSSSSSSPSNTCTPSGPEEAEADLAETGTAVPAAAFSWPVSASEAPVELKTPSSSLSLPPSAFPDQIISADEQTDIASISANFEKEASVGNRTSSAQHQQMSTTTSSPSASASSLSSSLPLPSGTSSSMSHYKYHNDFQSSVLTYGQVKRLDFVMDQIVPIHGRGNYPTLYVKLKELIRSVKRRLQNEHSIEVRDVRLNGGAASYILAPENSHYNDLDLIFGIDLSDETRFDVIRDVVLKCLQEFIPNYQNNHEAFNTTMQYNNSNNSNNSRNSDSTKTNETCNYQENSSEQVQDSSHDVDHGARFVPMQPNSNEHDRYTSNINDQPYKSSNPAREVQVAEESTQIELLKSIQSSPIECADSTQSGFTYPSSNSYQMPLINCAIKEAYVHKMVKVNDDDRWSLISLGVHQSEANCCFPVTTQLTTCQQQQTSLNTSINNNATTNSTVTKCGAEYRGFNRDITSSPCPSVTSSSVPSAGLTSSDQKQQAKSTVKTSTYADATSAQFETVYHNQRLNYNPRLNYNQSVRNQNMSGQSNQQKSPKQPTLNQHQQQFPNSIELKFVDKMRRKFEFSVDSFQIILDDLILFYDCAPQSMMSSSQSRQIPPSSHPSATSEVSSSGCSSSSSIVSSTSSLSSSYSSSCDDDDQEDPFRYTDSPSSATTISSRISASSLISSSRGSGIVSPETLTDHFVGTRSEANCVRKIQAQTSTNPTKVNDVSAYDEIDGFDNGNCGGRKSISSLACSTGEQQVAPIERLQSAQMGENSIANNNDYCLECHATALPKSASGITLLPSKTAQTPQQHHQQVTLTSSRAVISENFYPTVIGRSEYGNFKEALYHLERKLIATRSPEEIRGGGLLKYCNLLVRNYKPTNVYQIRTLERYMCSRFFIDFSDLNQQQAKLESYLANHFSDDPILKYDYLTILHSVVHRSTVCLMNHELRLTLNMIRDLAQKLLADNSNYSS